MALHTITLKLDELDYRAVQAAFADLQRAGGPPSDCGHDDANLAGRLVAEICRGYLDMLGKWELPGEQEHRDG